MSPWSSEGPAWNQVCPELQYRFQSRNSRATDRRLDRKLVRDWDRCSNLLRNNMAKKQKGWLSSAWYRSEFSVNLPQEFSSDPSVQSGTPLQKRLRSIHVPSWQANMPSWQRGSSVDRIGLNLRTFSLMRQFFTCSFQSQVCFSISKARPAGQRIACKP